MDMNRNKLAAGGAAVVMAAGIAMTAVGTANAAPGGARITSVEQLHQNLARAVEHEQALGLQGTLGDPVGREVLASSDAVDG
ncbi:hypothetical protein ACFXPI_07695 [Streptomyces sp. NPDC059104]|uniref:hypothetical protein n=1 Tax=unclassified Streptomyces TaxID=2593676 RepID=UPI0033B182BF